MNRSYLLSPDILMLNSKIRYVMNSGKIGPHDSKHKLNILY